MRSPSRSALFLPPLLVLGIAGACGGDEGRAPCGPDEVRIAERCVFVGDTGGDTAAPPDTADVGDTDLDVGDSEQPDVPGELPDTADTSPGPDATGPTLPFYVDEFYVMSGYMGTGSVDIAECGAATPSDSGPGACWKITWTPATGTTADWTGFYFQYPENNWGDVPGLPLPPGATRVTFRAWGAEGGESANFAVGIQAADGFQVEAGYRLLAATPTEYAVALGGRTYDDVAGAFAWFLDNPGAKKSVTFYLDDVRWVDDGGAGERGCTDTDAVNHDPTATTDDGSCTYAVSFSVDMGCPDPDTAFQTVWLTGPFCQWCGDGFPLVDPDGDGVYTNTYTFAPGPLEFKFMTNGFASQEDLIDDANTGGTCAPITDKATYANRRVTIVDAPVEVEAVYGSCGACP